MPIEYRPFVESGIREWNKAFEKIGFVDAIAVRWQEHGRDEFDPEDTSTTARSDGSPATAPSPCPASAPTR